MKSRWDGSKQSANVPGLGKVGMTRDDYAMYRGMVTKVLYIDDPNNITKNAQNPEVLYECVILGGHATGQTLSNCRLASWLGGNSNYSERILTPTSKDVSKVRLSQHDGDVVWIQFVQGYDSYPTIMAMGKGVSNKKAAKKADGPRLLEEYNGLETQINNKGEWSIVRKGGSTAQGKFTAAAAEESSISLKLNEVIEIKNKSSGKLKIAKNKVALGASGIEVLQQIVDIIDKVVTWVDSTGKVHTHMGNLGYPTAPPQQASGYSALASDLNAIKAKLNQIKGSL